MIHNKSLFFRLLSFLLLVLSIQANASGATLKPGDSNSQVTVENAVVKGNETTVFFYTSPYLGDPMSGKECPLNYYSVTLKPGLPSAKADVVGKGVCGGLASKSRLLDNGDALIMVRDRLERWRAGTQINSQTYSSIDAVSKLGVTTDMMGGQLYDISPSGDVVMMILTGGPTYDRKEYAGSLMVMTSMKPDGGRRWEERLVKDSIATTVHSIWAATDGGALVHMTKFKQAAGSLAGVEEEQLLFISADGSRELFMLTIPDKPFAFDDMNNASQEDMAKFFEHQRNSKPESLKKINAKARKDGGFDVLLYRKGGKQGREGHFLLGIGPDGSLLSETSLGNHIVEEGLERWFDFYLSGNQLILLSKVLATQQGVQAKRKKWSQNAVSRIDLDTGTPATRLIPLDQRYLEAAMNAGDAEMKYLDGFPGGEPALLTTLGGTPLVVSIGMIAKKQTLRLNEATESLRVFNKASDEKLAKQAVQKDRQQKANREMAKATGMSEEEAAGLSDSERMAAMMNSGSMEAMMADAMKQLEALQGGQGISGAQPSSAGNGQSAEEINAQIQAAIAQTQQAMRQAGVYTPDNSLKVDAEMRGNIEYKNRGGQPVTLLIFNRKTDDELLRKDYPDGVLQEHVDFSQFQLPLEQIGVIYQDSAGTTLKDLTPVIEP